MSMSKKQLIMSTTISNLTIDIEQRYIKAVKSYLESRGCSVSSKEGEEDKYLVTFPQGTQEEVYMGQSTQWTTCTTMRLPNGKKLERVTLHPLNSEQKRITTFMIPKSLLEKKE